MEKKEIFGIILFTLSIIFLLAYFSLCHFGIRVHPQEFFFFAGILLALIGVALLNKIKNSILLLLITVALIILGLLSPCVYNL